MKNFSLTAVNLANSLLSKKTSKQLMDLHRATYLESKKTTSFGSQVICDIQRNVIKTKGTTLKNITVKFNIPRNCKTFNTKNNYFVAFTIYPRKRISIPIKQNRNYQRLKGLLLSGWQCKTFGLTSNQQIVAYLSKTEPILPQRKNVLGIDINSKCFATSILTPQGKVLNQTYFGKDLWTKRKTFMQRRATLQSFADTGSYKARKKLLLLQNRETNFIKNRLGEIVRDITDLAVKYNADIAIENLKRFKTLGKRFNHQVMRIPFYKFKQILEQRCFDKNITLNVIDAYHTSKWCSHCGAVGKGHSIPYSIFKCKCGQIVNSDRKASLAIAIKSLLERSNQVLNQTSFFQFSNRRVSVNGLFRRNDVVVENNCIVHKHQLIESQRF